MHLQHRFLQAAEQVAAVADDAVHDDAARRRQSAPTSSPDQPGAGSHARLGHVVLDLERVFLLRRSPADREKAPADQQEVGDARGAERETGRREVEQEKPLPVASARKAEIRRLGGVPIRVIMPPSRVANDSGIRRRPGA